MVLSVDFRLEVVSCGAAELGFCAPRMEKV